MILWSFSYKPGNKQSHIFGSALSNKRISINFMSSLFMLFTDTYKTITEVSKGIYKEKASKFLSFAFPVTTEEEVKKILQDLRKEYFDANHHCYAYQLGYDKSAYRVNDDGEPSGTAGRPIYGQIQSFDLTNILIVVIRYFGGTKLGVSGLIRAYKVSACEALESAAIVEKQVYDHYRILFHYDIMNEAMRFIKENHLNIIAARYELECELEVSIRKRDSEYIYGEIKKKKGIGIEYLKTV
jgi:uncharacterized YigZ family protein